jgi:hypothetical protein
MSKKSIRAKGFDCDIEDFAYSLNFFNLNFVFQEISTYKQMLKMLYLFSLSVFNIVKIVEFTVTRWAYFIPKRSNNVVLRI